MKILFLALGSRGDIEPLLAIAKMMQSKNHEVIGVFPEQFKDLTVAADISFTGLNPKFMELMNTKTFKTIMGTKWGLKKIWALLKGYKTWKQIRRELVFQQHQIIKQEQPDCIVHNVLAFYPFLWKCFLVQKPF